MTVFELLAATSTTTAAKSSSGSSYSVLVLFVLVAVVAYFFLLRPQRMRARNQQQQQSQIDVGDEVVTIGGIVGRVTSLEGDRAWLELDSGVIVEFLRRAIAQRTTPVAAPEVDGDGADDSGDVEDPDGDGYRQALPAWADGPTEDDVTRDAGSSGVTADADGGDNGRLGGADGGDNGRAESGDGGDNGRAESGDGGEVDPGMAGPEGAGRH